MARDVGLIIAAAGIPLERETWEPPKHKPGPDSTDEGDDNLNPYKDWVRQILPPKITEKDICFNGIEGDDYENFELNLGAVGRGQCKTNRKPYDLVVCAILLRAWQLDLIDGIVFEVAFHSSICLTIYSSDGNWTIDWLLARALVEGIWPRGMEDRADGKTTPWELSDHEIGLADPSDLPLASLSHRA